MSVDKRRTRAVIKILCVSVMSAGAGVLLSAALKDRFSRRERPDGYSRSRSFNGHVVEEMRGLLGRGLAAHVQTQGNAAYFDSYVRARDPVRFLTENCVLSGDPYTASGNEVLLVISRRGARGRGDGARVRITAGSPPTASPDMGEFRFNYLYECEPAAGGSAGAVPGTPGAFTITVRRSDLSRFALFTSRHCTAAATAVWFTPDTEINGPIHTNGRFNFCGVPAGRFNGDLTQHLPDAYFFNNGDCRIAADSRNGGIDAPAPGVTLRRDYGIFPLEPGSTPAVMKAEVLGGGEEPVNGITVVNDGACVTGGIYIRGNPAQADNATIALTADANNRQVFTVSQGDAQVTVIVDAAHGRTIVSGSDGTNTYTGIPDGKSHEGILIYSNDDIRSVSGTVRAGTRVTIAGERDIVISGHIRYQDHTGSPLAAADSGNMLGIVSWGGNVRISQTAPANLDIHAVIMAPEGSFTVDNYDAGVSRGAVTLLGGAASRYYGAFGTFGGYWGETGYARTFVHDGRLRDGIRPPYFPWLSRFEAFVEPKGARREDTEPVREYEINRKTGQKQFLR